MSEPRYAYVHVDVPEPAADDIGAELFGLGADGVEQRDASTMSRPDGDGELVTLVAHFPDEQLAHEVASELSVQYPARVEYVVGDAWRDAWRAHFKPTRIGRRLVVRPSWEPVSPWPGEVVMTLDPGRAFGSGTHETTRLVLREIDRRIRGGERVLDAGCGSGVLSVAALLLGATRARAVDVEDDAVAVSKENARLNRVSSRLQVSTTPVSRIRGRFDLVLANIEARVLIPMAPELMARVDAGGTLILSGVLRDQASEVVSAYPGFRLRLLPCEGEWVALVLGRAVPE